MAHTKGNFLPDDLSSFHTKKYIYSEVQQPHLPQSRLVSFTNHIDHDKNFPPRENILK